VLHVFPQPPQLRGSVWMFVHAFTHQVDGSSHIVVGTLSESPMQLAITIAVIDAKKSNRRVRIRRNLRPEFQ
jgi:hypothetical protein